jgi:Spy/CpxP family protein refolding chaperone
MRRRSKIILAGVTTIAVFGGLTACGWHDSPESRADAMVEKASRELSLAPAQVTQLQSLKAQLLTARQEMLSERGTVHNTVTELLSQPSFDTQRALNLLRERSDAVNQQAAPLLTAFGEFYDGLTPQQQATLREHVQQWSAHRDHWHH